MTDDHEDYLEEGAAVAHAATHEDGGVDEMSVAGLEGETAELAIHAGLATVHQDAPNLILTHKGDAGAHHAKYEDAEAVAAMGALGDGNPLNHDKAEEWGATEHTAIGDAAPHHAKYTNGEAVTAMGAKADVNPLHHDKAAEWGATEHTAIGDAAPHHAKYTNAEAVTAMGAKADVNPLHHDKAAEWGATEHTAIGDAAPHHAKYTDVNARASINGIFGADGKANADIDLDTHKIKNVVDPVTDQEGATKKYVDEHAMPSGCILLWSGAIADIPGGWVLCDGTNDTPDLTARFIIHADADSGGTYDVGDTGGEATHTLIIAEMPSHNHTAMPAGWLQGYKGSEKYVGNGVVSVTGNTGGNGPHENRPPYYALAYIMKS